ncbi:PIG-L family deacetylase [Candidatus Nomurabacteria bacterium]|uniref:PIG-L family deacetylase n=1 Tax=candidate division WWE3 bacterium TaxID=2053526 RepID=A0A955IWK0_UNCKA|nr:PIG-L family deacetylase [candidate division WWE3 bacterium]MCB9824013.1 PIG-L family deacetylase [Candidatus Nomurabacteria bacterium]MCB9827016.1 PIG-L family deacetylase [Candidatus Nomurabacteria bacterium]MCB9827954.1 PIG-L family deacetylase [Candidatus Nomurabacteria bacterium]
MTSWLNLLDISTNSKVLFVYPHPDDESYASANLIKHLVDSEIACKVVCLTKGDNSTLKFGVENENLSKVREKEFYDVMSFLGVRDYTLLNFTDGMLENDDALAQTLASQINEYKPSHVVTYEPCGVYGHPDHIVVSKIVTELQSEFNYIILYSTVSSRYKPSKDSLRMAKNPDEVVPIEANVVLTLSLGELIHKLKTLRMYKSQVSLKHNFIHNLMHLLYLKKEYYYKKSSQHRS